MAKKNMIQREAKRLKLIKKHHNKRIIFKSKMKHASNFIEQLTIQEELQQLPRNSMQCRHRNRCWMTGRSRGFYRNFGLSRHVLRKMAHECLLPGVKKSSW